MRTQGRWANSWDCSGNRASPASWDCSWCPWSRKNWLLDWPGRTWDSPSTSDWPVNTCWSASNSHCHPGTAVHCNAARIALERLRLATGNCSCSSVRPQETLHQPSRANRDRPVERRRLRRVSCHHRSHAIRSSAYCSTASSRDSYSEWPHRRRTWPYRRSSMARESSVSPPPTYTCPSRGAGQSSPCPFSATDP